MKLQIHSLLAVGFFSLLQSGGQTQVLPPDGNSKEALLIANANYAHFPGLPNPISDARQLASALEEIGFHVQLVENAGREGMLDAIGDFESRLKASRGIAFFHYGGHGVQVKGKNFLIPTDADIPDENRVATRAVDLEEVMAALNQSGASANIVVLDACRDNPLPASSTRSVTRGLSVIESKPRNSIIVYAAEAGSRAIDGLFTPALAKALLIPGKTVSELITAVRKEVFEKSNGAQTPGEYNQLFEQIVLADSGADPLASLRRKTEEAEAAKNEAERLAMNKEADVLRQRAAKAERERDEALRRAQAAEQASQSSSMPPEAVEECGDVDDLDQFFQAYVNSFASNNPWEVASFYAPLVDYCYAKSGRTTRAFIQDESRRFIASYPQRSYSNISVHQSQRLSPVMARINYSYDYRYNGKKAALGSTDVWITVEKIDGRWLLTKFDETVHRVR